MDQTDNSDPSIPAVYFATAPDETLYPRVYMTKFNGKILPVIEAFLNGLPVSVLIDTGSEVSLMSEALAGRCGGIVKQQPRKGKSITGDPLIILGQKRLQLRISDQTAMQTFMIMKNCPYSAIIGFDAIWGMDIIKIMHWVKTSLEQSGLKSGQNLLSPTKKNKESTQQKKYRNNVPADKTVFMANAVELPARSETFFTAQVLTDRNDTFLFQPFDAMMEKYYLPFSTCLVQVEKGSVPMRAVNFSNEPKILPKGLRVGQIEEAQIVDRKTKRREMIEQDRNQPD